MSLEIFRDLVHSQNFGDFYQVTIIMQQYILC